MSLIGFVCPKTNKQELFDFCFKKCLNPCHSIPVLVSLSSEEKLIDSNLYHVTEILNPIKVTYLKRRCDYYRSPESLSYMLFGRAFHKCIEEAGNKLKDLEIEDRFSFENKNAFKAEIKTKYGTAILSGRPDLIIPSRRELWDFKTGKYFYEVQKLIAGDWKESKHPWQINIYRVYGYPTAQRLFLEMFIKDYSSKVEEHGVKPIEVIQVPIMQSPIVMKFTENKLEQLLFIEKHPGKLPDCPENELWGGLRCLKYCDVIESCIQGKMICKKLRKKKHA